MNITQIVILIAEELRHIPDHGKSESAVTEFGKRADASGSAHFKLYSVYFVFAEILDLTEGSYFAVNKRTVYPLILVKKLCPVRNNFCYIFPE